MRSRALLLSLALLAGCATTSTGASQQPVSAAVAAPAQPAGPVRLLAAAGQRNAPSQAEIERAFGAPDITRREGAGAALTYRLDSCALLLLFAANERNEMRLTEAHPSARRAGEAAPSLETCAAEAAARRS
ncbi:MAG: hypothetical protein JNJ63_08570 [Hyphomonadaceae bacterium]|nr:hypothetical protein [Hyphomonadaceae bacterium]